MPKAVLLGVVAFAVCGTLVACGGADAGTTNDARDGSMPDAPAPVSPLFVWVYPQSAPLPPLPPGEQFTTVQCLDGLLPLGAGAMPNCSVVSAQMLPGATEQELAACRQCDAPGLAPLDGPSALEGIEKALSSYPCVCSVSPTRGLPCPATDQSSASWCYAAGATDPGAHFCMPPNSGAYLSFSNSAIASGTLFVACFEPPVF